MIQNLSESSKVLLQGSQSSPLAVILDEKYPSVNKMKKAFESKGYEVFVANELAGLRQMPDADYSRTQILAVSTSLPQNDENIESSLPQYILHMFPMTPIILVGDGYEEFLHDRAASMFVLSNLHRPLNDNLLKGAIARCDEYVQLFASVIERIAFMRQAQLNQEPIARIIHDLNNQITGLKGGIDLLSYSLDKIEESENKSKIERYLNQFLLPGMSAIEEMLGNWRTLRDHQLEDPVESNAAQVAYNGVKIAATPGHLRRIEFEILARRISLFDDIGQQQLPNIPIQGNPRLIPMAIAHVVKNALEATVDKENGHVMISVNRSSEPGMWSIAVYDNGPGIPDDEKNLVWRSFYSTKKGSRLGLGLSLAKQIIDKCNGQIAISSSPLGGAGIEILFPSPVKPDQA